MKKFISKFIITSMVVGLMAPSFAGASPVSAMSVALDNHQINATPVEMTVEFTLPADETLEANETLTLTLENGFVFGDAYGHADVTVTSANVQDGDNLVVENPAANRFTVGLNEQTLTLTWGAASANIVAASTIVVTLDRLTNPENVGSYDVTVNSSAAGIDATTASVAIVADGVIEVEAVIESFITMDVLRIDAPGDIAFPALTSSAIQSDDDTTIKIKTNAPDGYEFYVHSTGALVSETDENDTIAALDLAVVAAGTEGWGFNTRANEEGAIGAAPIGGDPEGPDVDNYTGAQGNTLLGSGAAGADDTFTLSVVIAAGAATAPGTYNGTLTLRSVGTF